MLKNRNFRVAVGFCSNSIWCSKQLFRCIRSLASTILKQLGEIKERNVSHT